MTLKELARQANAAAEQWFPLAKPLTETVKAWAALHGWDASETEGQRLLLRQALLNSALREALPGIKDRLFGTPLDSLGVTAPQSLVRTIQETERHLRPTTLNFWADLYIALVPQAQRRRIGQFWTDALIAEWMVAWLLQFRPHRLVDVGCGAGNFLLRGAQRLEASNEPTELLGFDVSPLVLNLTVAAFEASFGSRPSLFPVLSAQDYLRSNLPPDVEAVVCNPPYTRHHHIPPTLKDALQALLKSRLQLDVSRQATMAFHFLLKLIADLPEGARAAVIVPMEVLDARYGLAAKRALCRYTTLKAIVHFSPQMNAFHKVDVGALILLFRKGHERHNVVRNLTLHSLPSTEEMLDCLGSPSSESGRLAFGSLVLQQQDSLVGVPKWLSVTTSAPSPAEWETSGLVVPLQALAKVVRGIATGANGFFVLPTEAVRQRSLEPYVVRTVHRNREVQDLVLDEDKWQALSDEGKCVWLLYLNGENGNDDARLQQYLREGEARGYNLRSLVQTRRRWFAMEQREVPAIFFTILTRGNPRFILNLAGVRPLNMFLLIYPNAHVARAGATDVLWALLNSRFSVSRLHSVSRTYGGNTLKVEPRELDNLPVLNPLALPTETIERVKEWIADFRRDRDASLLMSRVDQLVDTLLTSKTVRTAPSSLPLQLRLLEPRAKYRTKES